jgi:ParB family chromosome partitioning protein
MTRTRINDIADGADLDNIDVKPRHKTGLHGRGRAFLSQNPNQALNVAAESGVSELTVSTDDCRLWKYNDRIYEGLSMENCKSLVNDIQMNKQLQPVIARRDPEGKKTYQIIIGTRRFWACSHIPGKKINIALIDVDDKQAYKIMRSENEERDDTTVYEKAVNAKKVISEIYAGNQKSYCLDNDIGEGTLSNWMAIADMVQEVVDVIPNKFQISVKQAIQLRSLINKSSKAKKAILEKTRELKGQEIETAKTMKELIATGKGALLTKSNKSVEKVFTVAGDKKGVIVKQAANGAISIKVSKVAAGDRAAVIKAVTRFLI